jgi:hypothetical protein
MKTTNTPNTKDSIIVDGIKISVGDVLFRQANDDDTKLYKHDINCVFYVKEIRTEHRSSVFSEHRSDIQKEIDLVTLIMMNPQASEEKFGRKIISKRYMYSGVLVDKINNGTYKHYPINSDG